MSDTIVAAQSMSKELCEALTKSDQDRWHDYYCAALTGFMSNAKLNDAFAHEDDGYPESCAAKSADRCLAAFKKRWSTP